MQESALATVWRFGAVMIIAVLVLGVLNALPQILGGERLGVVRYASIEEAEARLGTRLYRPARMPAGWSSQPAQVRFAAGRPEWVEFVYEGRAEGDGLALCQTMGRSRADDAVAPALLPGGDLLQAGEISVASRAVRMQRVLLADGAIVHELWWREGDRRVMLRGRIAGDSLPRLAETMLAGTR